jgi:site-specific DNA-methyltransferase (cytosine-N4-specific)
VGIDINPLACLLTSAKLADANPSVLIELLRSISRIRSMSISRAPIVLREGRKVEWFSPKAMEEMGQIIDWINILKLDRPERLIVAAAVSAASRDASFARKDGWKLHRLAIEKRADCTISPWEAFEKRLRYCVAEISREPPLSATARIDLGDARYLRSVLPNNKKFDVILTSPPYGDSRTTVQYGAASALCLEFVSRIEGLEDLFMPGKTIDASCLGGSECSEAQDCPVELRRYWAGGQGTYCSRAVVRFLNDYKRVCSGMIEALKPGGIAAIVVGQRSTGGFRLKLDQFTIDQFEANGLHTISVEKRSLRDKHLPRRINRFARSASSSLRKVGLMSTISNEVILAFRKPALK